MATSEELVDGFVVLADNWSFIKTSGFVQLPSLIKIETIRLTKFRGVKTFKDAKDIVTINFPKFENADFQQVIVSKDEQKISGAEAFLKIRNCFISAMDEALVQLCVKIPNCETAKHWLQVESYAETLSKGSYDRDFDRRVSPNDINVFGDLFNGCFLTSLSDAFNGRRIETYSVWFQFGNNVPFKDFKLNGMSETANLKEFTVHIAKNISMEGYIIAWKLAVLEQVFGKPKLEYYVGLLKTVGNFYYNGDSIDSHEFDGEANENDTAEVKIAEFKFYCNMYKELHRAGIQKSPFSKEKVAKWLVVPNKFDKAKDCKQFKAWIKNIEKYNHKMTLPNMQSYYSGRIEAIISSNTFTEPISEALKKSLAAFKHFNRSNQNIIDSAQRKIKIQDYLQHFQLNVNPAIQTIKYFLNQYSENQSTVNEAHILTPAEFVTVQYCEAIICFALYGNASYRNNERMHPVQVVQTLKLRDRFYRNDEANSCFPTAQKFLFNESLIADDAGRWLYAGPTPNPITIYGRRPELATVFAYLEEKDLLNGTTISWGGVHDMNDNDGGICEEDIVDVVEILHPHIESLNNLVLSSLLKLIDRVYLESNVENADPSFEVICRELMTIHAVRYQTTSELSEDIKNGEFQGEVGAFIGAVYQYIELPEKRSQWLQLFCDFLEQKLYDLELFFPLPVHIQKNMLRSVFIIPIRRLPLSKFNLMDTQKLNRFSKLYAKLYRFYKPGNARFNYFNDLLYCLHEDESFEFDKITVDALVAALHGAYEVCMSDNLQMEVD